jgi:hypothetical protein
MTKRLIFFFSKTNASEEWPDFSIHSSQEFGKEFWPSTGAACYRDTCVSLFQLDFSNGFSSSPSYLISPQHVRMLVVPFLRLSPLLATLPSLVFAFVFSLNLL